MRFTPSFRATALAVLLLPALALVACGGTDEVPGSETSSSSSGALASSSGGGGASSGGTDGSVPDRCASPPCRDGERCSAPADCVSEVCLENQCRARSATDGVKNGSETDVDCGGDPAGATRCGDGKACLAGSDCSSLSCPAGTCLPPTSTDGVKNGSETGIDCGGGAPTNAPRCEVGATCNGTDDCAGVACSDGVCQPPSATDGIQNGTETAVDCGGAAPTNAPRCGSGVACVETADCNAVLCTANVCQPPSNQDGIQNGTESGIDCGGGAPTNAVRCPVGGSCTAVGDCDNVLCTTNVCQPPSKSDGLQNGTETAVDCGGGEPTNADRCATGRACQIATDCLTAGCVNAVCTWTNNDGFQNGTETDVDCGGGAPTNAPRCATDKTCEEHTDCTSSACAVSGPKAGRCVPSKSCIKNEGGFTCGRGDSDFFAGGINAYESCCETAPLTNSAVRLSRFTITAGRMRAFIERLNGNVRSYVQNAATKPAGWLAAWDNLVPSSVAEANVMLGPYWANAPNDPNTTSEAPHSKRSCGYGNSNGHTYWIPGQPEQLFNQTQLDVKALNCVGWHLVTAFCAWDGGRLATQQELRNAFTNGTNSGYPWNYAGGPHANTPYNNAAIDPNRRLNHLFAYGGPGAQPANRRITWWISPPGRFWNGWNKDKIEVAGNLLEWVSNSQYGFVWQDSFEYHTGTANYDADWRNPNDRTDVPNGYYALGARCAYP